MQHRSADSNNAAFGKLRKDADATEPTEICARLRAPLEAARSST